MWYLGNMNILVNRFKESEITAEIQRFSTIDIKYLTGH